MRGIHLENELNNAQAQAGALRGGTALQEVPAPTLEIEDEVGRLTFAAERVDNLIGQLSARLHSVRTDGIEKEGTATPKQAPPLTKLGAQLRHVTDRLDSLAELLAYQTRNLQLPN